MPHYIIYNHYILSKISIAAVIALCQNLTKILHIKSVRYQPSKSASDTLNLYLTITFCNSYANQLSLPNLVRVPVQTPISNLLRSFSMLVCTLMSADKKRGLQVNLHPLFLPSAALVLIRPCLPTSSLGLRLSAHLKSPGYHHS